MCFKDVFKGNSPKYLYFLRIHESPKNWRAYVAVPHGDKENDTGSLQCEPLKSSFKLNLTRAHTAKK